LTSAFDLALTGMACVLWYLRPALGPWPLALVAIGRLIRTLTIPHRVWRRTAFDLPLAAFLISAGVSAWLAYDPAVGWAKFWVIVGGLALYDSLARGPEAARIAGRPFSPRRLLLALLPAVIALYFLLTTDWSRWMGKLPWLDPPMAWLATWQPDLPGHRLHPNVAGGLMAALLPLQVTAISRLRRGWLLIGLSAFCLLMTGSRGAWIALAGAGAVWAAWQAGICRWSRAVRWTGAAASVLLGGAAAVIVLALGLALVGGGRLDLWRNSLDLARDTPFTGLGLGGFQMAYSSYVLMLHVGHTIHSHNLLLDIWLEQGLLGLAAFGWLVGAGVRSQGSGDRGAALAALGVILLHGLVDDAFYGSRGVLLLFVPFALLAQTSPLRLRSGQASTPLLPGEGSGPPGPPALGEISAAAGGPPQRLWGGRGVQVGALILVLVLALTLLPGTRAAFQANLGALAQMQAELGVYEWPAYPIQDALRRQTPGSPPPVDLTSAIGRYRVALALDPNNVVANRRLGQIELSQGAYESAAIHLTAAYRAAPDQQANRFLLGESAAIAGQPAVAAVLWATVGSPEWQRGAGQQAFQLRAWWYGAVGEVERQQRVEAVIRRVASISSR